MIGIIEIVFIVLIACVIWFVVFTALIKYKERKFINGLLKNFENQDKVIYNGGKKYDIKEELRQEKETLEKEKLINSPISPGEGERGSNLEFSGSDIPLASSPEDTKEKGVKKK